MLAINNVFVALNQLLRISKLCMAIQSYTTNHLQEKASHNMMLCCIQQFTLPSSATFGTTWPQHDFAHPSKLKWWDQHFRGQKLVLCILVVVQHWFDLVSYALQMWWMVHLVKQSFMLYVCILKSWFPALLPSTFINSCNSLGSRNQEPILHKN